MFIYGKDARGNVKPHALRLLPSQQGTTLSPLLVAPPNLAEPAVAPSDGIGLLGGGDVDDHVAADGSTGQTEHWSAKPIWSSEGCSTGVALVIGRIAILLKEPRSCVELSF